jgi:multidrug resistance efflux pump
MAASDAKTYQRLKERVAELKEKRDRAEGALGVLKARLADEFDAPTVKAARKKLSNLERVADTLEGEAADALAAFEKKWGDQLTEEDG